MASLLSRNVERLVQAIDVLIVDDNQFMRKVVRNLLTNVGVRTIYEASDGVAGLEAIRTFVPDIVILDWEMPLLDRMVAILAHPRPMVRLGDYYGPQPRRPDYAPLRRAAGAQAVRTAMPQAMPSREH